MKTLNAFALTNDIAPIERGSGQFFVFSERKLAQQSRTGILKGKGYKIVPCVISWK
jgi:hypothetical protein